MFARAYCTIWILVLSLAAFGQAGKKSANDFVQINDKLTSQLKGWDKKHDANYPIDVLIDWMRSIQKLRMKPERESLLASIKQVLEVRTVLDEGVRCTLKSHEILMRLDKALDGVIYRSLHYNPDNQLQDLVRGFAVKHALLCKDVYDEAFRRKKTSISESILKAVSVFMEYVIHAHSIKMPREEQAGFPPKKNLLCDISSFKGRDTEEAACNAINWFRHKSHEKSAATAIEPEDEVGKYLVEPCKVYVQHFDNIFTPAEYDLLWQPFHDTNLGMATPDFLHHLAYFRLCRTMLTEPEVYNGWRCPRPTVYIKTSGHASLGDDADTLD